MCLLEGNFPFIIESVVLVSREAQPVPWGVVHLRGLEGGFLSLLPAGERQLPRRQGDLLTVFLVFGGMSARKNWLDASWMSLLSV